MTDDQIREKIQEYIREASRIIASEDGGYSLEDGAKTTHEDNMATEVQAMDITKAEFEALYAQCDPELTTLADLTDPIEARNGFKVE